MCLNQERIPGRTSQNVVLSFFHKNRKCIFTSLVIILSSREFDDVRIFLSDCYLFCYCLCFLSAVKVLLRIIQGCLVTMVCP